jgi:hypothetical protein
MKKIADLEQRLAMMEKLMKRVTILEDLMKMKADKSQIF